MSEADYEFWTQNVDHQPLAKQYEQNIERIHPSMVTSKRMCPCLNFCHYCGWASTSVNYYEYRGERV